MSETVHPWSEAPAVAGNFSKEQGRVPRTRESSKLARALGYQLSLITRRNNIGTGTGKFTIFQIINMSVAPCFFALIK